MGEWNEITSSSPDIICLQEVGGFAHLHAVQDSLPGPLKELQLPSSNPDALKVYTIVGSDSTSAYLSQMIAVHDEFLDHIMDTYQGDRFIAARILTR